MATWKKIIVSGSNISQLNNDAGYLTTATDLNAFATASINGVDLLAGQQGQISFVTASGEGITAVGTPGTDTVTLGLSSIPNTSLANSTISGKELGTNLDSLVDGNGIVDFTYNGSSGASITVDPDGTTIAVGTNGIKVADGQIGTTQIADSLGTLGSNSFTGSFSGSYLGDGSGLTGVSGEFPTVALDGTSFDSTKFFVNDGASKFISGSQVGDYVYSGVSGDATIAAGGALTIANGAVEGTMLNDNVADSTTIEVSTNTLSVLKVPNALTAGTGVDLNSGTTYDGSGAKTINLDITEIITGDGANRVLTSDGDGTLTAETNFTFDGSTLTVTGDQLVTGDLTVQGTASFQNTTELQVADRFILMASGSETAGDGGIVIQQGTQNVGEVFGFDSGTTRFGLTGSFDATATAFTPDAFMAAVINTAGNDPNGANAPDTRYQKKGNLYVASNSEDIWIYS